MQKFLNSKQMIKYRRRNYMTTLITKVGDWVQCLKLASETTFLGQNDKKSIKK
jgi:hypothetical protein